MRERPLFVFCADDAYALPLAAAIHSTLSHLRANNAVLLVLDAGLSSRHRMRLERVLERFRGKATIEFMGVDLSRFQDLPTFRWMSSAAYARLLLGDLVSRRFCKAVYLDCDLIVEHDLGELWSSDPRGNTILAVQNFGSPYVSSPLGIANHRRLGFSEEAPYFNSGVMVVDLDQWRLECVGERALEYLRTHRADLRCHDQEGLNAALVGRWGRLDPRWNQMPHIFSFDRWPSTPFREDMRSRATDVIRRPYIIHFAARAKPWHLGCTHPLRGRFFHYLRRCGWFTRAEWVLWRLNYLLRGVRLVGNASTGSPDSPTRPTRLVSRSTFADGRYRHFDVTASLLGRETVLLRSGRRGTARVTSVAEANLLMACRDFATLDNHASALCRDSKLTAIRTNSTKDGRLAPRRALARFVLWAIENGQTIPIARAESEAVRRSLEGFVRDGFLASEAELIAELSRIPKHPIIDDSEPRISTVGIPTRGRPRLLERAVRSYQRNFAYNERDVRFVICADDECDDPTSRTAAAVTEFERRGDVSIKYVGKPQREALVQRIARFAAIDPAVLQFALGGQQGATVTTGASRNALLILSIGELALQVDDDTLCNIAPAPEQQRGLALSSATDTSDYHFFASCQDALGAVVRCEADLLGIHEKVLGRSVRGLVEDAVMAPLPIDCNAMSSAMFSNLRSPAARVAVSLMGSFGDSGMHSCAHRLFITGASFDRLASDESLYRMRLGTRNILRAPTQTIVNDGTFCMGMNIGLDLRKMVPPFMPVHRRQDGVMRAVMRVCDPHAFVGYVPYAILHAAEDGDRREVATDPIAFRPHRLNDLLELLITSGASAVSSSDPLERMRELGKHLMNVASWPERRWSNYVFSVVAQAYGAGLQMLELRLDHTQGKPTWWARDVQCYIAAVQYALTQRVVIVPVDLAGDCAEREGQFAQLVSCFGRLLYEWPSIIDAARELRTTGSFECM